MGVGVGAMVPSCCLTLILPFKKTKNKANIYQELALCQACVNGFPCVCSVTVHRHPRGGDPFLRPCL